MQYPNSLDENLNPPVGVLPIFLAILTIFLNSWNVLGFPLPYYLGVIVFLLLVLKKQFYVEKKVLLFFVVIFVHGMIGIFFMKTTSLFLMGKVFALSVVYYSTFSSIINNNKVHIEALIRLYFHLCFIVACIGLFQGFAYLMNYPPGYDFSWFINGSSGYTPGGVIGIRLNSVLPEPSYVAFTMGPAIVLSLYRLLSIGKLDISILESIIILIFAFLSTSSSVHVVMGISVFLLLWISARKALMIGGILLFILGAIIASSLFMDSFHKLWGLLNFFGDDSFGVGGDATTYTLYVHFQMALDNFMLTWGFGGGLGSHEYLFPTKVDAFAGYFNIYNVNSAGNVFNRLISELGILGILLIGSYVFISFIGLMSLPIRERIFHAALVAGIAAFLARNGTYAQYGLAFYIMLLVANYKNGMLNTYTEFNNYKVNDQASG